VGLILTLEVGSTITKANAFRRAQGRLIPVGQGFAATSVEAGDVGVGVDAALAALRTTYDLAAGPLDAAEVFVNSSAAGGLRMSVHGLTQGMTARAAREGALGAGAIVALVTVGRMDADDVADLRAVAPNIVLLAGGVDHGEKTIVLDNARTIADARLGVPVIYAGNTAVRRQVARIFAAAQAPVLFADNVFPDVDVLDVGPVRRLIHEVFNAHIVHAPGMARLRALTDTEILPTPGAVLRGAELFAEAVGDCLVVDVGGATTDVHSVTDGTPEWTARALDPEPRAKRTVEGDLGVYVNAANVLRLANEPAWAERVGDLRALPRTERELALTRWLAGYAVDTGVRRHAGTVSEVFTPTGRTSVVRGKDLTAVRWIVGTGGALTRVAGGAQLLRGIRSGAGLALLPGPDAAVLIDADYRFSALGTIAQAYPDEVRATFAAWVEETTG